MSGTAPLVAIIGPTASGKSSLGVWLAQQLGGEVLVCDSTQVYRRFDIGTGKLTPAEQKGVRHHLMDLVEPYEVFTAGEYRKRALEALEDIRARGRLPIFAAGTGLYLRALLEGLADAPTRNEELREKLRRRAERRKPEYLHELLSRLDPVSAARIASQDKPKIIRALEVRLLSGKPISELQLETRPRLEGFHTIKVGLMPGRSELYAHIDQRVEAMLAAGWAGELRRLLAEGVAPNAKPFQFIGYETLRQHLEGMLTLEETTAAIQQATRHYAKRQITWFRKEPGVRWFEGFGEEPALRSAILHHVQRDMSQP